MRGIKRFMAVLLAAVILTAAVPAMETQAATTITARFVDWGRREISIEGEAYTTYDASVCYMGVKKCNATKFYYEVYTMDGHKQLRRGYAVQSKDPNNLYPDYQVFKMGGARRTVVTCARVKALIGGVWSAYSSWVILVPPHTPDYIRHSRWAAKDGGLNIAWSRFNGMTDYQVYMSTDGKRWTLVKTTTDIRCTVTTLNGSPFKNGKIYYYRIVGRRLYNGKYIVAKGNTKVNYKAVYYGVVE